MKKHVLSLPLFVTLFWLGCGGKAPVSLGLPRDQTLSSLTTAQAQEACVTTFSATGNVGDDALRGACATTLAMQGVDTCHAKIDGCTRDAIAARASSTVASTFCMSGGDQRVAGCAATVGQLEDCLTAMRDEYDSAMSRSTCEAPAQPPTFLSQKDCQALNGVCPTLFGAMPQA